MKRTTGTLKRYIKRVGPKNVTMWTWTPELAKRSDCFEVSEKEALHILDPVHNPAPPNIIDLQHLDDNLVTMIGSLSQDQQKQLMVLMGQVQHGDVATPETPAIAINISGTKTPDDTIGHTKEACEPSLQADKIQNTDGISQDNDNPNGKPSMSAINKMTKAQLQEHSTKHFPDKPEFDIEDPNNTNDFMREKINEWWDELKG